VSTVFSGGFFATRQKRPVRPAGSWLLGLLLFEFAKPSLGSDPDLGRIDLKLLVLGLPRAIGSNGMMVHR